MMSCFGAFFSMRFTHVLSLPLTTLCWIAELTKGIINIRGEKGKTVCSNNWHCLSLGHFNWLYALCGFILYSFHVNLSTSFPTEVSTYWFLSPLLFSQQTGYVSVTKFLPHSADKELWKKIHKPYKSFINCIRVREGCHNKWSLTVADVYLHGSLEFTNIPTVVQSPFFWEKQVYCALRVIDGLSDSWSLKG